MNTKKLTELKKEELINLMRLQNKHQKVLISELKSRDLLIEDIIKYMGKENYHDMIETFKIKIS